MNDEVKYGVGFAWLPVDPDKREPRSIKFIGKVEHYDSPTDPVFLEPCPELTLDDYAAFWTVQQKLSDLCLRNEDTRLGPNRN